MTSRWVKILSMINEAYIWHFIMPHEFVMRSMVDGFILPPRHFKFSEHVVIGSCLLDLFKYSIPINSSIVHKALPHVALHLLFLPSGIGKGEIISLNPTSPKM